MSYFPTDIPFMPDEELIENGLKKPYKKPEIIKGTDLVPVVRCRDCKHWALYPSTTSSNLHECKAFGFAHLHTAEMEFCSRGERKE